MRVVVLRRHHDHDLVVLVLHFGSVEEREAGGRMIIVDLRLGHKFIVDHERDHDVLHFFAEAALQAEVEDGGTLDAERLEKGHDLTVRNVDLIGVHLEKVLDQRGRLEGLHVGGQVVQVECRQG